MTGTQYMTSTIGETQERDLGGHLAVSMVKLCRSQPSMDGRTRTARRGASGSKQTWHRGSDVDMLSAAKEA
ncbi:hypothetical protein CesoFtcFv8_005867 [Champsocephalus esox]|uniref:Uncharacterized protein n=2 Tax=Champsocephalus TaxID=52236 RepID=A0AAN8DV72_CHAGU|nr:hypothetical protein CesoFtcFv8_005867 [Champsocephalus esox]KAK5928949.1 hypothetical protein CgunFtcFv8_010226 [Champsocephalus gunnari]